MGAKDSKLSILTYEDAINRVTKTELSRLQDAYKRACAFTGIMRENVFVRDVLGDFVPAKLAQRLFEVMTSSSRGMTQRDLVTTLVLLTRGKQEERLKLIYAVYADYSGNFVTRRSLGLMVTACEGTATPHEAAALFKTTDRITAETFCEWIRQHPKLTSVSRWLLNSGGITVSLTDATEMPNFYQTLAGVTHLEESSIIDLEKHYWTLKSQSKTGRFDLPTFKAIVCPPLPDSIVEGLFNAFDENGDNHIDFKEISCGVSACCRGPIAERQKFCFKVFDADQDGKLDQEELKAMATSLLEVKRMSRRRNSSRKNSSPKNVLSLELEPETITTTPEKMVESPVAVNRDVLKIADSKFFQTTSSTSSMRFSHSKRMREKVAKTANNEQKSETESLESFQQENEDAISFIVSTALQYAVDKTGCLTLEEYQMWGMDDPWPNAFLNIVIEICHIVLGLRPQSPIEEGMIIRGWMQRSNYLDVKPGETWYVVASDWWNKWKKYTLYDPVLSPTLSRKWEHEALEYDTSNATCHDRSSSTDTISSAVEASETMSHANLYTTHKSHKLHRPSRKKSRSKENISTVSSGVANNNPVHSKNSPGPIVNSPILLEENSKVPTLTDEGGCLKDTVVCGEDFELLPEPVWRALHHWYGGQQALPRIVPVPADNEKPEIELYRLHILLLKHQVQTGSQQQLNIFPGSSALAGVGNATFGMLKSSLSYVIGSNSTAKRYLAYRATFSRRHTIKQVQTFLAYRLHIHYDNVRLWNYIDENNAFVMEEETATLEDFGVKNNSQVLIEVRNLDMSWPEEMCQLAKNNKRNKPKPAVEKGVTGLSNIGNTCFMNSALQCVSNTRPLTKYLLMNKHFYELNRSNPLGMKGHIAKRYGDLVQDLWSGSSRSIAPLKLRWTISKYAPRFNGFSQHDSQELLSFLLDGLHEDLNRVQEKPYVELKDSDGRPDEEVAQEAWENHLMRNQSIIVDLFHGQIRSQVRCMECNTTSVRFDPFTFLSLPLPMDNSMYLDVIMVRLSGETPVKYGLRLSMEDKYFEVRSQLAELCGIEHENLLLAEVFAANMKSFISDSQKVRTTVGGNLYAFEIPPAQTISLDISATNGKSEDLPNGDATMRTDALDGGARKMGTTTIHESHKTSIANPNAVYAKNKASQDSNSNLTNIVQGSGDKLNMDGLPHADDNSVKEVSSKMDISKNAGMNTPASTLAGAGTDAGPLVNGDVHHDTILKSSSSNIKPKEIPSNATATTLKSQCYVIAFHRKTFHQDVYFLSPQKVRMSLFGIPAVVPSVPGEPKSTLYKNVWNQVSRLVSPLPASDSANHAQDCDDSLRMQYPFILRSVNKCGNLCGEGCHWYRFCHGCVIECNEEPYHSVSGYIAIDWDPTALHLRYQPSMEREVTNHPSVDESTRGQRKPIDLDHCLRAFTTEEELGADELYYCGKCKKHQLAKKKLDIWRLPPILIIHLKRFQFVNGHWIKSHKVVNVTKTSFDPSNFMTKRENGEADADHPPADKKEMVVSSADLKNDASFSVNGITKNVDKHIKFADDDNETVSAGPGGDQSESPVMKPKRPRSAGPARKRKPSFREESKPLFDLYAVSCHSGILCGGHYVSYAKNPNKKWYCYNDSSCKEVKEEDISIDSSYILFYERQGIDYDEFMPQTEGKSLVDTESMDDDFNSEYKKYCAIQ